MGGPVSFSLALTFCTSGLRLAFNNLELIIPTSPVNVIEGEGLKPRMPGVSKIVVVNNRNQIIMRDPVQKNQECWLPDQSLLNSKCKVKSTEVPDAIDSVLPNLRYKDTVNMKKVTGLYRQEFTDKFNLGQTKPSIYKPRQRKEVNFLEKFSDSGQIAESEKWDTVDNELIGPEKIGTRNKP